MTEKLFIKAKLLKLFPVINTKKYTSLVTYHGPKTVIMLSSQAKKAMYYILRLQKCFGSIQMKDMFNKFDASVKSILCHGSHIWGYQYVEKPETVHIQFCKRICFPSYQY